MRGLLSLLYVGAVIALLLALVATIWVPWMIAVTVAALLSFAWVTK
jgi:hypothetical protein